MCIDKLFLSRNIKLNWKLTSRWEKAVILRNWIVIDNKKQMYNRIYLSNKYPTDIVQVKSRSTVL